MRGIFFPSGALQPKSLFKRAETNPADGRRIVFGPTDGRFLASLFQLEYLFRLALFNALKVLFKNPTSWLTVNDINFKIIGTIQKRGKNRQIKRTLAISGV